MCKCFSLVRCLFGLCGDGDELESLGSWLILLASLVELWPFTLFGIYLQHRLAPDR
jgi:hypothetical protein